LIRPSFSEPIPISTFRLITLLFLLFLFFAGCKTDSEIQQKFVPIQGGEYVLGTTNHMVNPRRTVTIAPYAIATHEVTNREFQEFVAATGYITFAEKRHDAMVFYPGLAEFRWHEDRTAYWRFPNGVAYGGIDDKMDHPVTCICFHDTEAYCAWAKVRLPTLDEWEVATRAGSRSQYFWGNDRTKLKEYANVWHGKDHLVADTADPWMRTSPVGTYAPNPWGLYDVYGNTFEFCADRPGYWKEDTLFACARGGSWWCSFASCSFFNSTDIGKVRRVASFSNLGFRVVETAAMQTH
jgi:formylglycine-generating enzyme